MQVRFEKLDDRAVTPLKYEGDNAYNLWAVLEEDIVIFPGGCHQFDTKIAIELPEDYAMFICNRGSRGVSGLVYGAHLIDSSYRGPIFLDLHNISSVPIIISDLSEQALLLNPNISELKGVFKSITVIPRSKPLAQGAIIKTETIELIESDSLTETERGSGALGHTDKK